MGIDKLFEELCISELFASQHRTLEEALAAYNESLFSGTEDGPSSMAELMSISDSLRELLEEILTQTCPGLPACTGQGTCQNAVCNCNEGNALLSINRQ